MTYDGNGNLYIADRYNHTIRKLEVATGVVTTLAGQPGVSGSTDGTGSAARFDNPMAIAFDGADSLYVADTNNHTIRKVTLSGEVTTAAGLAGAAGISDGGGSAARFRAPEGVACDGAGDLYIADTGNHTIRRMATSSALFGFVTTLAGQVGTPGHADGVGNAVQLNGPGKLAVDNATGMVYIGDVGNSSVRVLDIATGQVSTLVGTPGVSKVVLGRLPGGLNWVTGLAALPDGGLAITDAAENAVLLMTR
jgi:DNA-binding beta-propeller fold protein YncE